MGGSETMATHPRLRFVRLVQCRASVSIGASVMFLQYLRVCGSNRVVRSGKRDERVGNNYNAPEVEARKVDAMPSERDDRSVGDIVTIPARLRKQWGGEKRQTRWAALKQWRRT